MPTVDELLRRYIVAAPGAANPQERKEPFIREKGTPVWVIVGYQLGGHSLAETAMAFGLTEEEVQAALAYYHQHEPEIAQRIESSENFLG